MNSTKPSLSCKVPTGALSEALVRSADEERYLGQFWSAYLPNGRALPSDTTWDALEGWSNTIQALYPTDGVLKKTVLAMSLSSCGRDEGNKELKERGLRLYSSALQDMAVALRTPSKARSDSILTASKLFSLYEVSFTALSY